MIIVGLIGALGTLFLFGGGIAALLLMRRGKMNLVEWFCLSWLLGVSGVSFCLWIGGGFFSGAVLQSFVGATALLLGCLGWRSFRVSKPGIRLPRPRSSAEWILAAILAAQLTTIFLVSFKHTLGWDGLLIWEMKARYAFLNGGVLPTTYFQGAGRDFSHIDYPLAIPFAELWIYLWIGEANQFWAKILFPIFYAAGALLLALLGSRLTGRRWVGLLLATLLFFVPQASLSTGSAIVGYADFPLAVVYLACVGYLLSALDANAARTETPIFAACLACVPWFKNEGIILWAVAVVTAALLMLVKRIPRRYLPALIPGLVVALSWRFFLRHVHAVATTDFSPVTGENLIGNLHRLPSIYRVILVEISTGENWGAFWLAALVTFLFLLWRWRYLTERLLLVMTLVPVGLYSFVYVFSTWHHYLDHVASSVPRLLMQIVPVTLLGSGIAIASMTSRALSRRATGMPLEFPRPSPEAR